MQASEIVNLKGRFTPLTSSPAIPRRSGRYCGIAAGHRGGRPAQGCAGRSASRMARWLADGIRSSARQPCFGIGTRCPLSRSSGRAPTLIQLAASIGIRARFQIQTMKGQVCLDVAVTRSAQAVHAFLRNCWRCTVAGSRRRSSSVMCRARKADKTALFRSAGATETRR